MSGNFGMFYVPSEALLFPFNALLNASFKRVQKRQYRVVVDIDNDAVIDPLVYETSSSVVQVTLCVDSRFLPNIVDNTGDAPDEDGDVVHESSNGFSPYRIITFSVPGPESVEEEPIRFSEHPLFTRELSHINRDIKALPKSKRDRAERAKERATKIVAHFKTLTKVVASYRQTLASMENVTENVSVADSLLPAALQKRVDDVVGTSVDASLASLRSQTEKYRQQSDSLIKWFQRNLFVETTETTAVEPPFFVGGKFSRETFAEFVLELLDGHLVHLNLTDEPDQDNNANDDLE